MAPATFPGWSGFSVSGNQPSCCALATSTRPSLSPSHCRLVLRQHRSSGFASEVFCRINLMLHAAAPPLRCWPPSFRGVMSFVAQRPITESNRPPSYQASTGEPESNRHFLCWWPEVIPASGMARGPTYPVAPEKIIVAAKSLFTCFRITTAHSPTRKRAIHAACLWVRPGFGVATHAPVQFCTPALFLVGPGHLRGPGYGRFQGGS